MYLTFGYDVHHGTPVSCGLFCTGGEQQLVEVQHLVVAQHLVVLKHLGRTRLVRTHLVAEQYLVLV